MDPLALFKAAQREAWSTFGPLEATTTIPGATLVKWARVRGDQAVLDVACGTGVVALAAARRGARVSGLDLTPELLAQARVHSALAGVDIAWTEGDVEALPYPDASFDAVLSQFGHIFAPRPDVALGEMLRVLKPGGTLAFSTWPPHSFIGVMFAFVAGHLPPPPPGIPAPLAWGDVGTIRERLGDAVTGVIFHAGQMRVPALSLAHHRESLERSAGPARRALQILKDDPEKLVQFRASLDALISDYFEDGSVQQDFLMTRAVKR